MSAFNSIGFFAGYSIFVLTAFMAVFLVRKKWREGRFPLGQDVRVMRRAGEHLSKQLEQQDECFFRGFMMLVFLPLLGLFVPVWIAQALQAKVTFHLALLALGMAAVLFGLCFWRLLRIVDKGRDVRLGLYGERVVGDLLNGLMAHGYEVFHDVPCLGASGAFNLDHVVVGEGRVVVVETKTYRKRQGPNGEDHKVTYNGERLLWPHRSSTDELTQALRNAAWLQNELKTKLNQEVQIHAALTMPGWYVIGGPPTAAVLVENAKRLPVCIRKRFSPSLTEQQEDLIRRHLRSLCADVDFEGM